MLRSRAWPIVVVALLLAALPAPVTAANDTIAEFRVIASPFTSDNTSTRHAAGIKLKLAHGATVSLNIEQQGGAIVRHIASGVALAAGGHRWAWGGGDDGGAFVPDGDYVAHVVVNNGLGTDARTLPVRKGMPPIFPANPGAITVLINPGHGGTSTGAATKTLTEKFVNLDVGLRLRRLLEAAGVHVVMTRTTDTKVNVPPVDLNGDGIIGRPPHEEDWDELQARVDVGNEARADVHIFNHNNGAGCRCVRYTETFTGMHRTWTPEGVTLATFVEAAQIAQLDTFTSATWYPIDHGVRDGRRFFTLSPYFLSTPRRIPRPTLQPALLTESLFVSDKLDRELLRLPEGREALAIAMYLGIGEYLATREYGIRYELLSAPSAAQAGGLADYEVQVTNTGNLPSAGWQLQLHNVPAVPLYDGSDAIGDLMGSIDIPDGLAPGATTQLTVHATAPASPGSWLVKADVLIGGAQRPFLSQRGVVALQVPLTTDP
jgi:N-acetylmuramoyl-L-alanine amidase